MPTHLPFAQVDVFAVTPYRGNPLAVVLDASGLTDEQMQAVARWTNLSETSFVLPPTSDAADYLVRIWTPQGELPFAGHPTLGTAHAWLEHGGSPRDADVVRQECGLGIVMVRRGAAGLAFAAPPLRRTGPLDDADVERVAEALGIATEQILDHQWVDNGPRWCAVRLGSAEQVRAVEPDLTHAGDLEIGVVGMHPKGGPHLYEVRAFVPGLGVVEDPVTGSLNAGIAQWLIGAGVAPRRYTATQGSCVQRDGVISIEADDDGRVWVGGATTTLVRGDISI
ncbi:PhzF family phenazine biosynthesis protein [Janibacter sp. LM]|uniref:PhzF family phenazine biosynthesis protein n=1 Tax=Janibacter TaxID=53457 RepID=UPI0031F6E4B9